jgi:hypothetical protein
MNKKIFFTVWPLELHDPKIGSLLMFRKAIENILEFSDFELCHLKFVANQPPTPDIQHCIDQVFSNSNLIFTQYYSTNQETLWPMQEKINWYSSWYGIESQVINGIGNHILKWDSSVKVQTSNFITCHLKLCPLSSCPSIEHADCKAWARFFKSRPNIKFILLGDDTYPTFVRTLPNVDFASNLGFSLGDQFQLIANSAGFVGSASGFSSAAVLSRVKYTVFKHPEHHPDEYITPKFRGSHQHILRALDCFDNIDKWTRLWMT